MYLKCVSRNGKKTIHNKYTKVGKRYFKLNGQANYHPQGAFDDRAKKGIFVVMYAFLSIFSLGFRLLLFTAQ